MAVSISAARAAARSVLQTYLADILDAKARIYGGARDGDRVRFKAIVKGPAGRMTMDVLVGERGEGEDAEWIIRVRNLKM